MVDWEDGEAEKRLDKSDHVKLNGPAGAYPTIAQHKILLLSSPDSHQIFDFLFKPVVFSLNET